MKNLSEKIIAIDNGRFEKIINTIDVKQICEECYYFNPTITDSDLAYRCKAPGLCIAATLSKNLLSYIWWKLELITESDHLANIGI